MHLWSSTNHQLLLLRLLLLFNIVKVLLFHNIYSRVVVSIYACRSGYVHGFQLHLTTANNSVKLIL
jgi:hypothetical protein